MSTPPWANQAYAEWQSAIETTRRIQETYNDWLKTLDQFQFAPSLEAVYEQLNRLLSLQVQYFQQITPWMDAKIQELRAEENHNVTYHVGLILERINELQIQLASFERQIHQRKSDVVSARSSEKENVSTISDAGKEHRYHTFENIFRQPSNRLKEALRRYLPLFMNAPEPILDLGCGRGEFLELMKEAGKKAYGVDLSAYEVERLNAAGLEAIAGDVQNHLQQLDGGTVGGVFCSQVVEHLSPDAVYAMLEHLHRVTKTGAPVVIETVNPLSVFSYHQLFFKDPTHVFPVHPDTLVFMLRYTGFQDVQMHLITPVPDQQKLPEPKKEDFSRAGYEYLKMITARLNDFLYDSLEYYVVATRK